MGKQLGQPLMPVSLRGQCSLDIPSRKDQPWALPLSTRPTKDGHGPLALPTPSISGCPCPLTVHGQLHLSPRTVQNHVQHIYGKIEVSSRSAATKWALVRGIA